MPKVFQRYVVSFYSILCFFPLNIDRASSPHKYNDFSITPTHRLPFKSMKTQASMLHKVFKLPQSVSSKVYSPLKPLYPHLCIVE